MKVKIELKDFDYKGNHYDACECEMNNDNKTELTKKAVKQLVNGMFSDMEASTATN